MQEEYIDKAIEITNHISYNDGNSLKVQFL